MHARTFGRVGTILTGIAVCSMALSGTANAAAKTISVPGDFVPTLSGTRANGHYAVVGTGLHIWTDGDGDIGTDGKNSDKVAEYVATDTPLAAVGNPTLDYTNTTERGVPGYQLVVDIDGDGDTDGILVGEPVYGQDWWLADSSDAGKAGAPQVGGGSGSAYHGTLGEWSKANPDAVVTAFGFSLGSGVKGDGVINSITFAGDTYTFAKTVVLNGKDECKAGGWATSTSPVFKNQGDCVSSFATTK